MATIWRFAGEVASNMVSIGVWVFAPLSLTPLIAYLPATKWRLRGGTMDKSPELLRCVTLTHTLYDLGSYRSFLDPRFVRIPICDSCKGMSGVNPLPEFCFFSS